MDSTEIGRQDGEFCRVCRCEGTPDAPLFHPCKCSGSIRNVHQECLAEWLKHSQKRHCELCQTHFHFTRIYLSDMPSKIPLKVYVGCLLKKLKTNLTLSLRFILVCVLWLLYVPWFTQQAWRYSLTFAGGIGSPASEILTKYFGSQNILTKDPETISPENFLPYIELTNHKSVNTFITHLFEGYFITIFICSTFIFIFLVREWVMQNAPGNFPEENQQMLHVANIERLQRPNLNDDNNRVGAPPAVNEPLHIQQLPIQREDRENHIAERGDLLRREVIDHRLARLPLATEDVGREINRLESQESRIFFDHLRNQGQNETVDSHNVHDNAAGTNQAEENRPNQRHDEPIAGPVGGGDWPNPNAEQVALVRQQLRQLENRRQRLDLMNIEDRNLNNVDIEDNADDLDGLLEIIGIRGPIIALYQNILLINIITWASMFVFITLPSIAGRCTINLLFEINTVVFATPAKVAIIFIISALRGLKSLSDPLVPNLFKQAIKRSISSEIIDFFFKFELRQIAKSTDHLITSMAESLVAVSLLILHKGFEFFLNVLSAAEVDTSAFRMLQKEIVSRFIPSASFLRLSEIISGYIAFGLMLASYIEISPILSINTNYTKLRECELFLRETLRQLGSIVKFIFVISIEIVFFPVFCGSLLHLSLMKLLVENNFYNSVQFALNYPVTSFFIHWFVGTIYMFQFAMFVSMCRKIIRPGVLFFIRDPNDPHFHPIKEILERSITAQLKKIVTSALFYTVLIFSCFGLVSSIIRAILPGLFPIRCYTKYPIFEIPFDLLLFQFLVPFLKQTFKPSVTIKRLWASIFSRLSQKLRLSSFIFGGRYYEEEGYHLRRSWKSVFLFSRGDISKPFSTEDVMKLQEPPETVFIKDGSFLRVPAIDHIPTGQRMFHPVTEYGDPLDTIARRVSPTDPNFTIVYVPPHFVLRIILYLVLVWAISSTVYSLGLCLPLIVGRYLFGHFMPLVKVHDLYCLFFGALSFALTVQLYHGLVSLGHKFKTSPNYLKVGYELLETTIQGAMRWTLISVFSVLIIPMLIGLIWQCYILVPLFHFSDPNGYEFTLHLIHDWTFGFFVEKLLIQLLFTFPENEYSRCFREVFQNGFLRPKIEELCSRIIFPVMKALSLSLIIPPSLVFLLNLIRPSLLASGSFQMMKLMKAEPFPSDEASILSFSIQLSFPTFAIILFCDYIVTIAFKLLEKWRLQVQDEVYLVGEQLNNYDEISSQPASIRTE